MDKELQAVIAALQQGDKTTARNLLRPILQNNPSADAWFLASKIAPNGDQRIRFLKNALSLDPFHEPAAKDLSNFSKVGFLLLLTKRLMFRNHIMNPLLPKNVPALCLLSIL